MGVDAEFAVPGIPAEPASQRLTNDDFRKLLMTPRAARAGETPSQATPYSHRAGLGMKSTSKVDPSKAAERKKKKSFYAKMKKDEDDKLAELAAKYRDRAAERRDGSEAVPGTEDSTTTAYRAVAPNARENHDAAERRRQMIQESKYLGGDMEHTHLVKGLDFALLQKVRSEIAVREAEIEFPQADTGPEEEEEEKEKEREKEKIKKEDEKPIKKVVEDADLKVECRTILAKNIIRGLFHTEVPKVNELFFPGRMAYVMDLEEEGESDIPTTTIRSKKDVALSDQKATLSTNDIVINKLTQILSYLRAGSRTKKKKKDKLAMLEAGIKTEKGEDVPIYDDLGDYKPRKEDVKRESDYRRRDGDHRRDEFRRGDEDRRRDRGDHDRDRRDRYDRHGDDRRGGELDEDRAARRNYFDRTEPEVEEHRGGFSTEDKEMIKNLIKKQEEKEKTKSKEPGGLMSVENGYAECYPGLMEMEDAIGDSDEETDFSKMDLGNKKGPVGRWDFDTPEEYSEYMSTREALPKAAFQYGMKMADGRKTRGKLGQKSEKAKLDKEWNQISALLEKRKGAPGGGGSGPSKKPKYD